MSHKNDKVIKEDPFDGVGIHKTLERSDSFIFPHFGALKENLNDFIMLYNEFCPNEDCYSLKQELEGIVLDINQDWRLGIPLNENIGGRYILWCCPRCAWAFIERK